MPLSLSAVFFYLQGTTMSRQLLLHDTAKQVWLVDSSIYVFRAWFVKGNIPYDRKQNPINAVQGFLGFLYAFLHDQQPEKLAFAFDISLQTSKNPKN